MRKLTLIFQLVVFLLAACKPPGVASPEQPGASMTPAAEQPPAVLPAADQPGRYQPAACRFALPEDLVEGEDIECGFLTVPEDRSNPNGRLIRLAIAVLHPPGGAREPDPVIYLSGGPGAAALETLRYHFEAQTAAVFAAGRDLILFDQRGIGLSRPALDCPGYDARVLELLDYELEGEPVTEGEISDLILDSLRDCRAELSQVADLGQYNSTASADDVEEIRRTLAYEQVNLWGVSYGSRLGLEVIRRHPEQLRSVVLEAVYPPDVALFPSIPGNFWRSLDLLFSSCLANPVCQTSYPDLEQVLFDTVARLEAEPVPVEILDPFSGEAYPAYMDGGLLLATIFQILYDSHFRYLLPELVYAAAQDDFTTLLKVRGAMIMMMDTTSRGMLFSVHCHEEVPFDTPGALQRELEKYPELNAMYTNSQQGELIFKICGIWDAGEAAPQANQPVTSELPVLILNGEFDPITPPAWGIGVAERMPDSAVYTFPGIGHGASMVDPCPAEIFTAFLNDPGSPLDSSCMAAMER